MRQQKLPGMEGPRRKRKTLSPEARRIARSVRDLSPKEGDGLSSVTISVPATGKSGTLTSGTRKRINRLLREHEEG